MTLQSIEDDYVKEVEAILIQQNYHPDDMYHIVNIGRIFFQKGYQVGLDKGWQFQQDSAIMKQEED